MKAQGSTYSEYKSTSSKQNTVWLKSERHVIWKYIPVNFVDNSIHNSLEDRPRNLNWSYGQYFLCSE